jgi:hypothetical protein
MRDPRSLSDQELDRLLAGKVPDGGDPVDRELAEFIREARTAFLARPAAQIERRHVAAALEVSRLNVDKGEGGVRTASKARRPDSQASGPPRWRRRTVLSSLFASLFAKIAGVAIAAAAATGGLAAAGALPAPAQQVVAHAASTVGIHVPSSEHASSTSEEPLHPPTPAPTSTVAEGKDEPTSTASPGDAAGSSTDSDANHGACVSYAASVADSLGMTGGLKGQFMSVLARDSSARSAKVAAGGKPDAACQAAILKAKAAATTPGKGEDGASDGKPSVTVTATATPDDHPGASDHPDAKDHPGNTDHPGVTATATPGATEHPGEGGSNPGTGNPTGVSPANHPGKP